MADNVIYSRFDVVTREKVMIYTPVDYLPLSRQMEQFWPIPGSWIGKKAISASNPVLRL